MAKSVKTELFEQSISKGNDSAVATGEESKECTSRKKTDYEDYYEEEDFDDEEDYTEGILLAIWDWQ